MSTTSIPEPGGRAWVDVDLSALVANARTVASVSAAPLLPMVKADGYGLGAITCARALEAVDPWGFGVATAEEGARLRAAGIKRPVLVFTPLAPEQVSYHIAHGLRPVIGDVAGLRAWLLAGSHPFHVEVDTGMSRTGFRWDAESSWRELLLGATGFEGIFTHFHSPETDPASVLVQWDRFHAVLRTLPTRPALVHAANSSAALQDRIYTADLVRPGIFLYGGEAGGHVPQPVATLRARVVAVRDVHRGEPVSYGAEWIAPRDTRIATLGIGYADGVHRSLGNKGLVEIGGRVTPIAGRVTMDFVMISVDEKCQPGDVATVFGGSVSLDEQARLAGTIAYELLTALGPRVARHYTGQGA